jgi:hypothetical protein
VTREGTILRRMHGTEMDCLSGCHDIAVADIPQIVIEKNYSLMGEYDR